MTNICPDYVIKSSYGNDSCALIQHSSEIELENVVVIYNDTGWARDGWLDRVARLEEWVKSLGFMPERTSSIGLEALARKKTAFPRQGMQFCTSELKIKPTLDWLGKIDPLKASVQIIGVRRCESANRADFPMFSVSIEGFTTWAPLVCHSDEERNELLWRAGIAPLTHRSDECFPCINSNRSDILRLAKDPARIAHIRNIENSMGFTKRGAPRTMFRPYRYQGSTGIDAIVEWAKSPNRQYAFDLDDGNGSPGCEAGECGL
jgi:3'-phosphoadenosine 5'-phosphosulfate sulfotransferase (PAPS reductase)/FAD synthetase